MNNVTIMGQLIGSPEIIYENDKNENKKLYKLILKVQRPFKSKNGSYESDYINVKAWSNTLGYVDDYYEDSLVSIEGRLISFASQDKTKYLNEVFANKVVNYN
ncbi:single-stranded DNA-binding protein [Spiroplasma endosymbiont of Crioceris asparagi]|uniref:single-stranded DNA-binding protein n=1 Tax=Spiroplasma endosymbiont of Crioceris asparagi TaxID=3066286 RepID=UPI0030D56C89